MPDEINPELYGLLKELCPLECDIVGDSVVRDISEGLGPDDFEDSEGGGRLDFKTVIEVLAIVAALITALLQLRNEWRAGRKADSAPDKELEARVRELEARYAALADDVRRSAVNRIFPEL